MTKTPIFVFTALAMACGAASAADYYVVVPVKNRVAPIQVALSAASLPKAKMGNAYSYSLKDHLQVTGDPGLDLALASFKSTSVLPTGLSLTASGLIAGTPTATNGGTNLDVVATYKGYTAQQLYTLIVGSNSQGVWSLLNPSWGGSGLANQQKITDVVTAFNTRSPGKTDDKVIFINNIGTNGNLALGFNIAGDTAHYKIVNVTKVGGYYAINEGASCGAAIGAGSISPCVTDAVTTAGDPWTPTKLRVQLQYAPLSTGNHNLTLTPVNQNEAEAPAPLTLTASSVWDATGLWSSYQSSWSAAGWNNQKQVVTPTADIAALSPGRTVDKVVYLNNIGGYGSLSAGFDLAGDLDQYQVLVYRARGYAGTPTDCLSGGVRTGNSISPCLASDPGQGSGDTWAYSKIQAVIRHQPTSAGRHSITLTPTTNNGSAVPSAFTFVGDAIYDPTGVWSSYQNSWGAWGWNNQKAVGAISTTFGSVAQGATSQKVIYLNNTGGYGQMAAGLDLAGDVDQYQVQLYRVRGYSANTVACLSGGVRTGNSISPCLADDPGQGAGDPWVFSKVQVVVTYKPTASGTHNLTLTPTSNNGSTMAAPVVLSGSAP